MFRVPEGFEVRQEGGFRCVCKRGEEEQPQKVPDLVRHCLCGRVLCEKAVSTRVVGARGGQG